VKLYNELAWCWPLMSPPDEYAEEAAFYLTSIQRASSRPVLSALELGSGGGNNASHMKQHLREMVLVDVSPGMLAMSRALNPELTHYQGDMRTMRLERQFDAVFVHDAICYMTTESDLRKAIDTAFVHCKPGGVALFCPDYISENFESGTDRGGVDAGTRGMRWLEWRWDPDPGDSTYLVDYACLLREPDGSTHVEHDHHVEGLFPRDVWLRLLRESGFEPLTLPLELSDVEPGKHEVFVCVRPASAG
jgi:SAM-dependent methyltransferase